MKKRAVCLWLAGVLLMGTTGCGGTDPSFDATRANSAYGDATAQQAAEADALEKAIGQAAQKASVRTGEDDADKEETVYVVADATGATDRIIVSNWLKNYDGTDEVKDVTTLKNIENVKGMEAYDAAEKDLLTWKSGGRDIYYRGTTEEALPFSVKVTYFLEGKEVSPEEIAGKHGNVKIRFDYENFATKKVTINDAEEEVYTPFLMMSALILDADKFRGVKVENGEVTSDADRYTIVGYALPGLESSLNITDEQLADMEMERGDSEIPDFVEISAYTEGFELGMTLTVVTTNALDLLGTDLYESEKLDDLKTDMDDLSDGSTELVDGVKELKDGTTEFKDGGKELKDGVIELKDGVKDLKDGTKDFKDGALSLKDGVKEYTDGVNQMADGITTVSGAIDQVKTGAEALAAGINSLKSGIDSTVTSLEQLKAANELAIQILTALGVDDPGTGIRQQSVRPGMMMAAPPEEVLEGETTEEDSETEGETTEEASTTQDTSSVGSADSFPSRGSQTGDAAEENTGAEGDTTGDNSTSDDNTKKENLPLEEKVSAKPTDEVSIEATPAAPPAAPLPTEDRVTSRFRLMAGQDIPTLIRMLSNSATKNQAITELDNNPQVQAVMQSIYHPSVSNPSEHCDSVSDWEAKSTGHRTLEVEALMAQN
ncbi:MAG: hypothetical protein IJR58_05655, partial [Lachnospiraceae bacterium]|nr:hypothetical protein [Lachnospiraceae bacterium]